MFKRDLVHAYRQFRLDPADIRFVGYSWRDNIFIDLALVMGSRSAAHICQRITNAISAMCKNFIVINYLDDLAVVSPPEAAHNDFQSLSQLFSELGLVESVEKAVGPTSSMEFLGVQFCAHTQTMSITEARLVEIRLLLESWLTRKRASKCDLQSLVGKLQFVAKCVIFSRIFISRMLLVLSKLRRQSHKFCVTAEFHKDVRWWLAFISRFNEVSIIPNPIWSEPDTCISTDACLSGGGGWSGGQFFRFEFPLVIRDQNLHINALELLVILVAVKLWIHKFPNARITVFCDNMACVQTLNSGRSRDTFMIKLLREIAYVCMQVNSQIRGVHLPGVENRLADQLSRSHRNDRLDITQLVGPNACERVVDESMFSFDSNW